MKLEQCKNEINRLKLELEKERKNKELSTEFQKQVREVVDLASEMRTLLAECRYQQIDLNLAKKIDSVLKKASYMD